jgi:PGM1 C-terminal domain/ATP-grasp domain
MGTNDIYLANTAQGYVDKADNLGQVNASKVLTFKELQEKFTNQYKNIFPDKLAPRTVVVIPSLSLDQEILSKISGVNHYEERMLCMLMLLRMPRTNVVFVTSETIDPVIIDYYLHMLPGVTGFHAQKRLTLLSCYDSSSRALTQKILERPRLIKRIRSCIGPNDETHMACFNVTEMERKLALLLQIPIFGCDPDLYELGNKSNGRKIFREFELPIPPGFEDLYSEKDIVNALVELKKQIPSLQKAVVKMNEGFSGDGNAIFVYGDGKNEMKTAKDIKSSLRDRLKIVSVDLAYEKFIDKFSSMGGIVETYLEGDQKRSPSVQCRINPTGETEVLSTHDQILAGESNQVYIGAQFPASRQYAVEIGKMGKKVGEALAKKGVLGRFAIDFISIWENNEWKHYLIEINLRKGGTMHPYMMLQFLTDGDYNPDDGLYYTSNGHLIRYYFCSDNLESKNYRGLTPYDLLDIAMMNDLNYDGTSQEGVMFHLMGALSQYGKLGVVCIGSTPRRAKDFYERLVNIMDKESLIS